jgi:hypothetical protein
MTRPPSVLHSQITQIEREDDYLHFLLGLVSFSRSLLAALEHESARGRERAPPDEPRDDRPSRLLT